MENAEVIQCPLAFQSFIDVINFSKSKFPNIIAFDETAAFMSQGAKTTIDQTGASAIYIASMGYKSATVTCILKTCLNGTTSLLLTITKGKKKVRME